MAKTSGSNREQLKKRPPATTPEGRENQMISLAMDVAEKRMRNGTATAQEVVHFLKLGSVNTKYEREILKKQKELLEAKTEAYQSAKRVEELYSNAINAFRNYSGTNSESDEMPGFDDYDR